jgi:FlhB-like protein
MSEDKDSMLDKDKIPPKAVALGYNPNFQKAPHLIAKGQNHVAEKIIEIARKKNIPIYRSETLVNTLYLEKTGDEIPMKLYDAVAVILAYIYKLDKFNV